MDINKNENNVEIEEIPDKPNYTEELLEIIRSSIPQSEKKEKLFDYHENDIATVLPLLTVEERKSLYKTLGIDFISEVFTYLDDPEEFISELTEDSAADIIETMDADDAIDILNELPEEKRQNILNLMDEDALEDVNLIHSYDENLVGSRMTTNYVYLSKCETIKQAMKSIVNQAAKNDNISTIYLVDENMVFCGAIYLRDLVIAREGKPLEEIAIPNYPFIYANEQISECIDKLKDYSEDSIPVLDDDNKLIGAITSSDIVEAVDEALGDDYAKFAGLTEEEDFDEPLKKSIVKRIPWLLILLGLGLVVSTVIQGFQTAIPAGLVILYTFQSLILDMSGNTGTQSLGVTIRVLSSESLTKKEKWKFVLKELRVAFCNGLLIGTLAFLTIGVYLQYIVHFDVNGFLISGCIGLSLLCAMIIAGLDGTLIPMLFTKLGLDPAVASGPLITTVNDFVAVCAYYGISILFLVNVLNLA